MSTYTNPGINPDIYFYQIYIYFSLVVQPGVKQYFTVVGQARFVFLDRINSIWVIAWQWYDVWNEKEKTWTYTFTDYGDL